MQNAPNRQENKKSPKSLDVWWKTRVFAVFRRVISTSGNKSLLFTYLNKVLYVFLNAFDF